MPFDTETVEAMQTIRPYQSQYNKMAVGLKSTSDALTIFVGSC